MPSLSDTMEVPVAPNTDYQTYSREKGLPMTGFARKLGQRLFGTRLQEDYEAWKQSRENQYNADLKAYNDWLQTPTYAKSALEAAGYNANYTDGFSMSPSSPGSYQTEGNAPAMFEPMSFISQILDLAGKGTGIASQGIGSYMSIIGGLADVKSKEADTNLKHLSNNVQRLALYKIATELFGGENANNIVKWLEGGEQFIELPQGHDTMDSWLSSMLKEGPFMQGLSNKNSKLVEEIDNLITKGDILGNEKELGDNQVANISANNFMAWLYRLAMVVAKLAL